MIDKIIGDLCTACTSCVHSCPKNAIKMVANKEGFLYPIVNYDLCVKCKICIKKCSILNEEKFDYDQPIVYAGWNLNDEIRINSTSGGIFTAIAKNFIAQNGYVCGAIYADDFKINHFITNKIDDIDLLRQSKYAQSNLSSIFPEIKMLLNKGKKVLFCGTPCQSSGLQTYLGKLYENLYCCDFICRGVISQKVYTKFLEDISGNIKNIEKVHFKNKEFGWNGFSTKISLKDGKYYHENRDNDYYMRGYLKHNLYLRLSCHDCKYKQIPRISDLSLGDFWGIGNFNSSLDNNKGTSVILVNSQKGNELIELIKNEIFLDERNINEVTKGNACLLNSAPKGKYREYFFDNFEKIKFDKLIEIIDEKSLELSGKEKILWYITKIKNKIKG